MADNKDYEALPLEALQAEEKKMKKNELLTAVAAGFLVGVMIYGIATKGFGFLYIFILSVLLLMLFRNSKTLKQELKQVRAAIGNKTAK